MGDSTSDGSEKLLQRDGGKDSIYVALGMREYMQLSTYLKVSAGLMKLLLVMRNSCHHEGI